MAINYDLVGIWLQAVFTIMILSLLYKDNLFSRFAVNIMIGLEICYVLVIATRTIQNSALIPITQGEYAPIIYVAIAALLFTTFNKKLSWLAGWTTALLIGGGLGVATAPRMAGQILSQIRASIPIPFGINPFDTFSNAVIFLSLIFTLAYFLFTIKLKGPLEGPLELTRTIGRSLIMLSFGTIYGMQIMGYLTLFLARIRFLLFEWLRLGVQ